MFYNTNKRFFKQIEKSQSDGAYQTGSFTDMFQVWIIYKFLFVNTSFIL